MPLLFTEIKNGLSGGLDQKLGELLPGSIGKSVAVANKYRRAKDDVSGPLDSQVGGVVGGVFQGQHGEGAYRSLAKLVSQPKTSFPLTYIGSHTNTSLSYLYTFFAVRYVLP